MAPYGPYAQLTARTLEVFGTSGNDSLTGVSAYVDILHGGAGNDTLTGAGNSDTLDGGMGNDSLTAAGNGSTLDGGAGDDVLTANLSMTGTGTTYIGGTGNDILTGAYANDTYLFNLGDGQDRINEYSAGNVNTDVLQFGAGITPSNVTMSRSGTDLVLKVGTGTDQITVVGWFSDSYGYRQIEQMKFSDGTVWTSAQVNTRTGVVSGTEGADSLTGTSAYADVLQGMGGNDTLTAVGNGDRLDGGAGNDVLNGAGTGTVYIGGAGNDTFNGVYDSDTYLFNLGDGQDRINEYSAGYVNTDVLQFSAGINPSDVSTTRSGTDLVLKVSTGTDQITVVGWFADSYGYRQVEQVKFADGTVWTNAQLTARTLEVFGTSANDSLTGVSAYVDILHGGAGNDTLAGAGNNDTLDGGLGNDSLTAGANGNTLDGGAGDDVLTVSNSYMTGTGTTYIGGTGNDTVTGSSASDTYLFNLGDGQDRINEYSAGYANTDVLQFSAGINPSDVTPVRSGLDLVLKVGAGTDQITVVGWFADSYGYRQVEQVKFADGTVWTNSQLTARTLEVFGTSGNDSLTGVSAYVDILHGGAGNDTLTGAGNSDTLDGGMGNDSLTAGGNGSTLDGGAGDDVLTANLSMTGTGTTYVGGTGNDNLTGAYASDTYLFNLGDGQDRINEYSAGNVNTDVLQFGAGIGASDIAVFRNGQDLVLQHLYGLDRVTVANWFVNAYYQVETVKFADGTAWTNTQLTNNFASVSGTSGADVLSGIAGKSSVITALAGNDNLSGTAAADFLDGGTGNDTMAGGAGHDTYVVDSTADIVTELAGEGVDFVEASVSFTLPINVEHLRLTGSLAINGTGNALDNALVGNSAANVLAGMAGNDTLVGGAGSDKYLFGRGDGADVILDYDPPAGASDSVAFGSGISTAQLWFSHVGSDLKVSVIGTADSVTISGWYSGSAYQVEQFTTADGKMLTSAHVQDLVNTMSGMAQPAMGQTALSDDYSAVLVGVINASWI